MQRKTQRWYKAIKYLPGSGIKHVFRGWIKLIVKRLDGSHKHSKACTSMEQSRFIKEYHLPTFGRGYDSPENNLTIRPFWRVGWQWHFSSETSTNNRVRVQLPSQWHQSSSTTILAGMAERNLTKADPIHVSANEVEIWQHGTWWLLMAPGHGNSWHLKNRASLTTRSQGTLSQHHSLPHPSPPSSGLLQAGSDLYTAQQPEEIRIVQGHVPLPLAKASWEMSHLSGWHLSSICVRFGKVYVALMQWTWNLNMRTCDLIQRIHSSCYGFDTAQFP